MRVPQLNLMFLTFLTLVGGAQIACIPTLMFGPSKVITQDCRGPFTAEVEARREGVRKVDVVFELLPGDQNLADLDLQPGRARIKGRPPVAPVTLRARLVNACEDGGVSVLGSFPPTGSSGYIGATAVVGAKKAGGTADPETGEFSYPLTVQCCGEKSAGTFVVAQGTSDNLVKLGVEPDRFACVAEEEHTLTVRGVVEERRERALVKLAITHDGVGATCSVTDAVAPGAGAHTLPSGVDGPG